MITSALLSPSQRILRALAPEEGLTEFTLTAQFGESRPVAQLLECWQIDERVQALLGRAQRTLVSSVIPVAIENSDTYRGLVGTSAGFVVQFAALCQCRDTWGKQALLAAPRSANGLWRALVWAGTGRGPWSLALAQKHAVSVA
jgi:hypothetical protein